MTISISEDSLIPILQRLIQFNTENPTGITKEIVKYIDSLFRPYKDFKRKIKTYTKDGIELHNYVCELGMGDKKIILCGHLDTVPIGDIEKWQSNPFEGTVLNAKTYGRGSADMKGGITSLIGVMFSFLNKRNFLEEYTLVLALTADEEAGMSGAEHLESEGIMNNAELLIIPEATNLQIGIAEKGIIWAKVKAKGKAAHGSMPEKGINAIEELVSRIPDFYQCISSNESKLLGKSTLNIGTIIGGSKINVVPEEAIVELDYRIIPEENIESVCQKINKISLQNGDLEISFLHKLDSLNTTTTPFIDNLMKLTKSKKIGLSYGTDAAKLLSKNKNIPFVIFGPGDNSIIHQTNEFVPNKQIVDVAEYICQALIQTFT